MQQCGMCRAVAPAEAETCLACGAPLDIAATTHFIAESNYEGEITKEIKSEPLSQAGLSLMIVGISLAAYGLLSSGAPEHSSTLNVGLLNDKSNYVAIGGFSFTGGAIFFAAGAIIRHLGELLAPTRDTESGESREAD